MEVALAVIAVTTAVKDIVEVGQKIHKSFAKVSDNFSNARRVAEDIKEMVEEIEVFCQDHKDALEDMKDFCDAVQGLLGKFRSFEASTLPLLPQTGGRRRDRLFRGWDAWRNNNKIEGSILVLQSDILKVMRRYMMKSAMRTEAKLETIYRETSKGLKVLEVVRRDVSALCITTAATATTNYSYEASGGTSDDFNCNVIVFAKSTPSTSAPMLRTPNVITEELMTAAYIKLQVNSIAMTLEKISTLPVSAPISFQNFQMYPVLELQSMSITHLRHHVVRQVIGIRDLLDTTDSERIDIISIYDGGVALNNLCIGLRPIGMDHESIPVGKWAIMLARTLVDALGSGHPTVGAHLALYLLNQSLDYNYNGDNIHSLQAIEEAYTITQNWPNQHSGEVDFQILHSDVLLQYANLVDNQRSIKMCVEAIQVLENILNVQAFTQSKPQEHIEAVLQPNSSFLNDLFSSAPPITAIRSYAVALQRLGTSLAIDGDSTSALNLAFLAIAVRRKMVSIHGHKLKVDLAETLSSLVEGAIAMYIPADELVSMAEECIQLFRELAEINTLYYARQLVFVLSAKASALGNLNRDTEAIETWEEAASIAGQIIQDSKLCATALGNLSDQFRRLKRHDDAVRTGTLAVTTYHEEAETRAARYYYLSKDLQQLRRYKEAAEAAQTSVTLYRHLVMRDPRIWMGNLTEGLSDLAYCLAALGDYSEALIVWTESVSMLESFLNIHTDPSSDVIDRYCAALCIHRNISYVLKNEEECLHVGSTAIRYLRRLLEARPQNANIILNLLWAEFSYAGNMFRVSRLQDTQEYIGYWLDLWSNKPDAISESEIAAWHAATISLKAAVLDAQGSTQQALLATLRSRDNLKLSGNTDQHSYSQMMIHSMFQEARLRINLGDSEEALQVAEGGLRLARANKQGIDSLLLSLRVVSSAASLCGNHKRAFEAAREGYDILVSPEGLRIWQKTEDTEWYMISICPSLLAALSSAEANLGRCSTALNYAHRAVDMSLEIGDMKLHTVTTAEESYMETRGSLADILLATGDLAQARQICEERRAYFLKRVKKRMGDNRELAPILRMLGVLCCSEGHHQGGDAAAKELSRIMKMLGSAFPSLQDQVKIRLRNQAKAPFLEALNEMSQKLDCGHQAEFLSLIEI